MGEGPPRDAAGLVVPHDDAATVLSTDKLVRRLHPNPSLQHIVRDDDGRWKASSAGFKATSKKFDPYESLSTSHLERMVAAGREPATWAEYRRGWGLALLVAGVARDLGFQVGTDPEPDNEFHVGVWGVAKSANGRRELAATAVLLLLPDGWPEGEEPTRK